MTMTMIQTWPWRCCVSHSRWCWMLISCWWQLLIPILSICQGLYHLVNVRARFWGWQALNHFLLTCSGQRVRTLMLWDSLYCTYTNFMLTNLPWWCNFLPSTQLVLQTQLQPLYLFTPSTLSFPDDCKFLTQAWQPTRVSVRWSKNILKKFCFQTVNTKAMFQLKWLTPEFLLCTVIFFIVPSTKFCLWSLFTGSQSTMRSCCMFRVYKHCCCFVTLLYCILIMFDSSAAILVQSHPS